MTIYIIGLVMCFIYVSQFIALSKHHPHHGQFFLSFENYPSQTAKLVLVILLCACWPLLTLWAAIDATYSVYFRKKVPRWLQIWTNH